MIVFYKRNVIDLADAPGLDIIVSPQMPSVLEEQKPMEQVDKNMDKNRL